MSECVCENLFDKLEYYVNKFNSLDEECYQNDISNAQAFEWMKENIPLLECPDKVIEEIYYFRWWTFRKHIKNTPDGYVVTEFLPKVGWSVEHNCINAAAGHHILEGRWLKNCSQYLEDYIRFWLNRREKGYTYSMWLVSAIWDYCSLCGDYSIGINNLDALCEYYTGWEEGHLEPCGLFWSIDNYDAMEYTISGTAPGQRGDKGFRPTLNSYMAADAYAISRFANLAGRDDVERLYKQKGDNLRKLISQKLWDNDFFKAQHVTDSEGNLSFGKMTEDRDVHELIGYIPWCFDLPEEGKEIAFLHLKNGMFTTPYGLATADKNHPRFLYEVDHECLWNGYVWPFATSQTLTAVSHLIHNYKQNVIDADDFYYLIRQYADMHYIVDDAGIKKPWIDEVMNPLSGEWSSRNWLKERGWPSCYERGKDYNHSTFCDLVLNGLLGISFDENGKLSVNPLFPREWKSFRLENLHGCGKTYSVISDNGSISIKEI